MNYNYSFGVWQLQNKDLINRFETLNKGEWAKYKKLMEETMQAKKGILTMDDIIMYGVLPSTFVTLDLIRENISSLTIDQNLAGLSYNNIAQQTHVHTTQSSGSTFTLAPDINPILESLVKSVPYTKDTANPLDGKKWFISLPDGRGSITGTFYKKGFADLASSKKYW